MTFASAGPGTTHHIGFEKLKRDSGLDFVCVPYLLFLVVRLSAETQAGFQLLCRGAYRNI